MNKIKRALQAKNKKKTVFDFLGKNYYCTDESVSKLVDMVNDQKSLRAAILFLMFMIYSSLTDITISPCISGKTFSNYPSEMSRSSAYGWNI